MVARVKPLPEGVSVKPMIPWVETVGVLIERINAADDTIPPGVHETVTLTGAQWYAIMDAAATVVARLDLRRDEVKRR